MNDIVKGDAHLSKDWLQFGNEWDELRAECSLRYIASLEARIEKLRWALKQYERMGGNYGDVARAALEGDK